jgi:cysteine desulfurase
MNRVYLDHAATTPMRSRARAAVAEGFERWANPSSAHSEGRAARARERIGVVAAWSR